MFISAVVGLSAVTVEGVAAQDFDAVLAAPDDPDLNLDFARRAADAGDLNGAAGALERVLIADPNRHGARLMYALILYRLDDLQGARDQLDLLDPVTLTSLQRAEATRYRARIERARSSTRFSGSLSTALTYEEDAAGALTTQFDTIPTPPATEEGGAAVIAGRLNVAQDLGNASGYALYGSVGGSDRSTFDDIDGDVRRGDVEAGLSYTGRLNSWAVSAVARALDLMDEPNLREAGIKAQARWRASNATMVSLSGEAVNQAFDEPAVDAVAAIIGGDRDGWRYDINLGVSHRLTARSSVGASVGWVDKQADYEPFGYSGPSLQARYDTATRRGHYLAISGGMQWLEYDAPDPVFIGFGAPAREDVRSWARVAVGAPISAFTAAGATGDWRQDVGIEGALTYGARDSLAPLGDYDSWGAELRLTWRFGAAN
ncbi:tetratricopeptide repeat protein [Brevundimonas sp.]|uniref:tetratricopeptide repeat protein n=1 Tax=Brevundimonas sp. TaxID=1871086 RepID=UPI002730740A|nr:tetratricopeptide repeat protein [Brevundimonas sp.]MDP1913300.1 tetratricopeptide repeat protein [Brevundimonas sp.]